MKLHKYTNLRFIGMAMLLLVSLMFQRVSPASAQDGAGSETISDVTFFVDGPDAADLAVPAAALFILDANFDLQANNAVPTGWVVSSTDASQWGVTDYVPVFTPTTGAANSPTSAGKKVWVSAGGTTPVDPSASTYPVSHKTTMRYQLNLSQYNKTANFSFWYFNDSEDCSAPGAGDGDFFRWGASTAAAGPYTGMEVAGFSGGWKIVTLDLSAYMGQPSVWVVLQFESDADANVGDGAYVDDVKLTATGFKNIAATASQSGYLRESGLNTNVANQRAVGSYWVGDSTGKGAYRIILSFNTTGVKPVGTDFKSAQLRVTYLARTGNSFTTTSLAPFNGVRLYGKNGFFGSHAGLQLGDFNLAATNLGNFPNLPTSNIYIRGLNASRTTSVINTTGVTQFRLQFNLKTDMDAISDLIKFNAPKLLVTYGTP